MADDDDVLQKKKSHRERHSGLFSEHSISVCEHIKEAVCGSAITGGKMVST